MDDAGNQAGSQAGSQGGGGESTAERALAMLNDEGGAQSGGGNEPRGQQPAGEPNPQAVLDALGQQQPAPGQQPQSQQPQGQQPGQQAEPSPQALPPGQEWMGGAPEPLRQALTADMGKHAAQSVEQLRAQMQDARALYEIAEGTQTPHALLGLMKENYPNAFAALVKTANELAGNPQPQGPADPAMQRLKELEDRYTARERQDQERATAERQQRTFKLFNDNVAEFAKKQFPEGMNPEALKGASELYGFLISSEINGNKDILQRIESGNYADVERLGTQVHNRVLGLLQAYSTALVEKARATAANTPRIPARGAAPAPAGTPKGFNAGDRDERQAAALAQLNG